MNNSMQSVLVTGSAFFVGLLAGGATGLLLAPHSGSHARRQLRDLGEGIGEHASRVAAEATEAVNEVIEYGKCLTR